jgi:cytochrome c-type biogenesis protein CcmH/NrfF
MGARFNKQVCHPERSRAKHGAVEGPAFKRPPAKPKSRLTFWLKTGQALALAVAVCFSLGATDAGTRYNALNHRLMCTCGCAEILGECNHVGCQNSTEELNLLRASIANGDNDQKIFDSFAAKYGATVLAAPPASGFNLVAWIAPFAVFAAALLGTILLVRQWSVGKSQPVPQPADPEIDALRERIRRETGDEGGY